MKLSTTTNFSSPTYIENQVIHQYITNLPPSVPRTSTFALNNATLPYIILLAEKVTGEPGLTPCLLSGLNVCNGVVTHEGGTKKGYRRSIGV